MKLNNLRPWEKIQLVVKRHWIVFLALIWWVSLFVGSTILTLVVWDATPLTYLFLTAKWIFAILALYVKWLNVELDMFVITNNRIIWVEQIKFLDRTVSEANLGQVQEVNSKTEGLLSNILDYGRVLVQTAWNASDFDMQYAPEAIQNARRILNIVDDYRDKHAGKAPETIDSPSEQTP